MRHGTVTAETRAALACAAVLAVALAARASDDAEQAPAAPSAPWRAIDIRTPEDADRAWAMVRDYFGNKRLGHAHEVWETDAEAMASARPLGRCLAALGEAGLDFPRVDRTCHLSAQVQVRGAIEGVEFSMKRPGVEDEEGVAVGCELALRLPRIARVLREAGVVRVTIGPPGRVAPQSYHRFGLALDVYQFTLEDGRTLVVEDDWERRRGVGTCDGEAPAADGARILRDVACRLFEARVLSTVITPNYNDGHRNHFHLDLRPGDERFYLR